MSALAVESRTKVPVVLPQVRVEIDADGLMAVTLDGKPYQGPREWMCLGREAVPEVFEEISTRLALPIRVEVIDGGSTFTDIVTPSSRPPHRGAPLRNITTAAACEVAGFGFEPNESVAIAVVVTHQTADADGHARLRLPPSLLANRSGLVVLLGQTSGAVAVSGSVA